MMVHICNVVKNVHAGYYLQNIIKNVHEDDEKLSLHPVYLQVVAAWPPLPRCPSLNL